MTMLTERLSAIQESQKNHVGTVDVGIILGSGLGKIAQKLADPEFIQYSDIPGMPTATAPNHAGQLIIGSWAGKRIALCSGRYHLYEGHAPLDTAMTVYLLHALSVPCTVITNAAGAINPSFRPGDVMLIEDHINFTGLDPTCGIKAPSIGPVFTDMSRAYCPNLRDAASQTATEMDLDLHLGIYAGVHGPCFETSAERRAYRRLGADAVGMSTVMEVMAANHCGIKIAALSAITNMATGDADQQPEDLDDVYQKAEIAGQKIEKIIDRMLTQSRLGPIEET